MTFCFPDGTEVCRCWLSEEEATWLFLSDFRGIVLHVNIQGIEVLSQTDEWVEVRVGAGVVWDDFVAYAVAHGWYGAETLADSR